MNRAISGGAQMVQQIDDLLRRDPIGFEPAQQVRLAVVQTLEKAGLRRYFLGQNFAELPQLDQRGIGVGREIMLRQNGELKQRRRARLKKPEIGVG